MKTKVIIYLAFAFLLINIANAFDFNYNLNLSKLPFHDDKLLAITSYYNATIEIVTNDWLYTKGEIYLNNTNQENITVYINVTSIESGNFTRYIFFNTDNSTSNASFNFNIIKDIPIRKYLGDDTYYYSLEDIELPYSDTLLVNITGYVTLMLDIAYDNYLNGPSTLYFDNPLEFFDVSVDIPSPLSFGNHTSSILLTGSGYSKIVNIIFNIYGEPEKEEFNVSIDCIFNWDNLDPKERYACLFELILSSGDFENTTLIENRTIYRDIPVSEEFMADLLWSRNPKTVMELQQLLKQANENLVREQSSTKELNASLTNMMREKFAQIMEQEQERYEAEKKRRSRIFLTIFLLLLFTAMILGGIIGYRRLYGDEDDF